MNNKTYFSGCSISMHQCRCFDTLTENEKKLVEKNSVSISYKKGEVICKRGSFASHVMYLERGLAKVYIEDGVNTLVLKILPEKNLLGLASVSDDFKTFEYSVMAYIDSEILQIDIGTFKKLLVQNPVFAKEVIDIQNANSVQIYGRFFCLTHKQSFGRLADILLCLSDRIFKKDEFELPLSRKELAELSGLSSETVIRMLKVFRQDSLIGIEGKMFKLLDREKMKQISETG
ncbi:MAG TPA: hypothetical protein DF818_09170 [Bacteroidales bacterium]|nr:hypothetical protein [Bacteroidales bacterium]